MNFDSNEIIGAVKNKVQPILVRIFEIGEAVNFWRKIHGHRRYDRFKSRCFARIISTADYRNGSEAVNREILKAPEIFNIDTSYHFERLSFSVFESNYSVAGY